MSIEFAVLASSSKANCFYVGSDSGVGIVIDAGLPWREVSRRLRELGRSPESVKAVFVTHEHTDHSKCLGSLMTGYRWPVYATEGTMGGVAEHLKGTLPKERRVIRNGDCVEIGDLRVISFPVGHDATEPVGYCVKSGKERVTIATDLRTVDGEPEYWIKHSDLFFLESNYDPDVLAACEYELWMKMRVRRNHLSNEEAAEVVGKFEGKRVVLGHVSAQSNKAELVRMIHRKSPWVTVCGPGERSELIRVAA